MRETDFIGQNKEKWVEFERVLHSDQKDAEKLSRLFVETTDDLSYSRTYYPNRSVRVYLNGVAQQIYQKIYRNRKRDRGAFKRFWYETLPDAMWFARRELLLSFLIFVLGVTIGMVSSSYAPEFVEIILGEYYLDMTEANIEKGDPMAVYKGDSQLQMFLRIAWNNINVGFLCFIMGIFFEAGTIFIILSNAVMVGAFVWFFVQRDLFWESFYAIMLHGTLELSMIVLAGAAGLVLGKGLVFPGSYTRLQAFLLSARHGIRIMIGVSFFLLIAAFIEGYATRHTEAPNVIRGAVILLSLAIVVGYFVWYPRRRHKEGKVNKHVETETMNERQEEMNFRVIKNSGSIINETWRVYMSKLGAQAGIAFLASAAFTVFLFWMLGEEYLDFFDRRLFDGGSFLDIFDGFWFWDEANNFFNYGDFPLLYPIGAALLSFILWWPQRVFGGTTGLPKHRSSGFFTLTFFNSITAAFILLLPFLMHGNDLELLSVIVCIFWWPFWLFVLATAHAQKKFILAAVGDSFKLLKGTFGRLLSVFFLQGLVGSAVMGIVSAPLFYLVFQIIGVNFAASLPWADQLIYILHTSLMIFALCMMMPVMLHAMMILHYSNREINTADELRDRISKISFKKRAYGLEKEA